MVKIINFATMTICCSVGSPELVLCEGGHGSWVHTAEVSGIFTDIFKFWHQFVFVDCFHT